VTNPRVGKLNALASFTTDIILLVVMFFGLFRLRFYKSNALGMGRLLWRQVGYGFFFLAVMSSIR
jgi:hypothetical protein